MKGLIQKIPGAVTTGRFLFFLFLFFIFIPGQGFAADIAFMVIDGNSYLANLAVDEMESGHDIRVVANGELEPGGKELQNAIENSNIIVVDVMGRELADYLIAKIKLQGKTVYALRGSHDDEQLRKQGFLFDEEVAAYYQYLGKENIKNMLQLVIHRHLDSAAVFEKVKIKPQLGIYHPDAPDIFSDADAFHRWQAATPGYDPQKPRLGLLFFSSFLTPGQQEPIDNIIYQLEEAGFLVQPCFGRDQQVIESFLLDPQGRSRVDIVLAYSLKFYSALNQKLAEDLRQLDVPIISAITLYRDTVDRWRASPIGIGSREVTWTLATPEISGLIEPTVLTAKKIITEPDTGKVFYVNKQVNENIDRLIPRLQAWINLQRKPNNTKKVAILFYNHHQGKQNIGASYLNVFASLEKILSSMSRARYNLGEKNPPEEEEIKQLILRSARNIGSWAPGELDKMVAGSKLTLLDLDRYKKWFVRLPQDFQDKVVAQWGTPSDFKMMLHQGKIVLPMIRIGNFVLMPEPSRGWGDDPFKLYHDTTLYPHHQYIAAYLWLQKDFGADAMIHLGTHATYEWTPGKQAGLSPSCPPEVLVTDIPNLYPYIVDNVGEAIQAKRRGRGVMLSHLTPMLRRSELYEEYSRMAELVNEYERAVARGSSTAGKKFHELKKLAETTGILADLDKDIDKEHDHFHKHSHQHDHQQEKRHDHYDQDADGGGDDAFVHLLGHYLEDIKSNLIPYGMHTYGRSKGDKEVIEMAEIVVRWNPKEDRKEAADNIRASANQEMENLLQGLIGRYVSPGEGNDPLRNPGALPTGRNLYGFNPAKLPSPAAWELGKKAADQIIANHLNKHKKYPNKVAVIVWATETLRNEGVNESTILWLMGIQPKWQKSGRVAGLTVVPGKELRRPRIDVLINASGLYRDLFPDKMEMLDEAVQLAIRQSDIENLIAENSRQIKSSLLASGMEEKEAEELSRLRVFSEEVGSYGNGVSTMASASGLWKDEREVVDVYENRMGFVFGSGRWGAGARQLLRQHLAAVDVAVHSRSSNTYGLLDNDDMFQYLGGLAMAVRHESGSSPDTLITDQRNPGRVRVEDIAKTLGREMRSRYLNPRWIEGMKREDYAGARAMSNFIEYLWGWQMTTPAKVDAAKWQQAYDVYVVDKYGLELKEFFNKASPWSFQSLTGRMLETIRKGYWQADEQVKKQCAVDYATSVIEKGVACCDHTCNNPLLNQMVVSLISLPGVMSPELVEQFKLAIEQAAKKSLADQVIERKTLQQQLVAPSQKTENRGRKTDKVANVGEKQGQTEVEGYKMEKMKNRDETTEVTSSGVEWLAGLVVLFIIALAVYGAGRKRI